MFEQLVVGVDGRPGSDDAMRLAHELMAPAATVTYVHVYPGHRWERPAEPIRFEAAQMLLADAVSRAPSPVHSILTADSSPGRGLQHVAAGHAADLIVTGACHRHGLGRALGRDDAADAMNGAPCAVAIAPAGYVAGSRGLRRVGVACDRSPRGQQALAVARELARRHSATVHGLSVVSLNDAPEGGDLPDVWPKLAGQLVVAESRRLRALDGVQGVASYGDPAEELLRFSADLDLLVVVSRGLGPVARLLHGSTTNYLARRIGCPLLVLPPMDVHAEIRAVSVGAGR